MPAIIPCPKCGARLKIPDSLLGKQIRCATTSCGHVFEAAASLVTAAAESHEQHAATVHHTPGSRDRLGPAANGPENQGQQQETSSATSIEETIAPEQPAVKPADLVFLSPPQTEGELGRLGPYIVHKILGRGAMGLVLKALDPSLDRIVAIKLMASVLACDEASRSRFLREAKTAAAISHDNVVAIHSIGDENGLIYLVMQFVDGMSLQDCIEQKGKLAVHEILRIGRQIALGLDAAHGQGLIHRDIKPANILLEAPADKVKITDFGLARPVDDASMTKSGTILGTPQYMSPEQTMGEVVDFRSDLFSLGSVLYAMATGHAPFRANSTMQVLLQVWEREPRPIRDFNPAIPTFLVEVIKKLMAKDKACRYQTAAEVAELLGRVPASTEAVNPIPSSGPPVLTPVLDYAGSSTAASTSHRPHVPSSHIDNEDVRLYPRRKENESDGTGLQQGMGVASLCVGIIAVLVAFIPCIGMVGFGLAGIGLILGVVGLIAGFLGKTKRLAMPISGVVVNMAALGVAAAWYAVISLLVPQVFDEMGRNITEIGENIEKQTQRLEKGDPRILKNLNKLGLAMLQYHEVYGQFPAVGGKSGRFSWRVELLPYLDEVKLHKEFRLHEPWNSIHNKALLSRMPDVYCLGNSGQAKLGYTYYQVFIGPDGPFANKFGPDLTKITDGVANTFMIVEASHSVPWTKPSDLAFNRAAKPPRLGHHLITGFHAVTFDGNAHFIRAPIDDFTLRAWITHDKGEVVRSP